MRNWLADKGELAAWQTRVIKRLDEVYPLPKHENREVWMGYLPHTQSTLKTRVEAIDDTIKSCLPLKVGKCSFLLGQYEEAEAMHRQALELRTTLLGAEQPNTLNSMTYLATTIDEQG